MAPALVPAPAPAATTFSAQQQLGGRAGASKKTLNRVLSFRSRADKEERTKSMEELTDEERAAVGEACMQYYMSLKQAGVRVKLDDTTAKPPGWKSASTAVPEIPMANI